MSPPTAELRGDTNPGYSVPPKSPAKADTLTQVTVSPLNSPAKVDILTQATAYTVSTATVHILTQATLPPNSPAKGGLFNPGYSVPPVVQLRNTLTQATVSVQLRQTL